MCEVITEQQHALLFTGLFACSCIVNMGTPTIQLQKPGQLPTAFVQVVQDRPSNMSFRHLASIRP